MGVNSAQATLQITGVAAADSDGSSGVLTKTIYVMRTVNGIQVSSDRLIFEYHADTGEFAEVSGTWTPVDYADSQFDINAASVDELVANLIARFAELRIEPGELADVMLFLNYRANNETLTLNLLLEIGKGISILDMDI